MNDEITMVFLHGAGTGPWVWQRVLKFLPASGLALEVPGRHNEATPDSCAEAIASELDRRQAGQVAIVMHSLAGVLAPGLSGRLGDRMAASIYISAVIPPEGRRFVDALGLPSRVVMRLLFAFNRRGLKPTEAMIRKELCNDLSEEDADRVVSTYAAEWPGLYLTPVGASDHDGRTTYIKLTRDQSLPASLQDQMIGNLSDPIVREIAAGHLVMLSQPEALGQMIMQEVASC